MSKHLILSMIFGLLLASGQIFAQKGKIKRAYNFIEALDYQSAIDILLPLANDGDNPEVPTLLGQIFRKQNSYNRAAVWYEKAIAIPGVEPSTYFYYGMMLLHTGRCGEAQQQFTYFLSLNPLDPRQHQLKDACTYRQELLKKQVDSLEVRVLEFNSVFSDIGPAFYRSGLVFGSVRTPARSNSPEPVNPFYDLYYVEMEDGVFNFSQPVTFSDRLNSRVHEAIVTFNQDASKIYFTRNQGKDNEHSSAAVTGLEIVYATSEDGEHWGELQILPFNSPKYSIAHPSLSPDSKQLFFASDMPGGFGGKDIYVSSWDTDHWAKPVNLGPLVNTEGDEMFPYYHPGGNLYFSSDGQVGLGGQDIFSTRPNMAGVWDTIQNVGAPINTEFDDYGLILSEDMTYGFFTSNRSGGIGKDDIYGFRTRPAAEEPADQPADENKIVIHIQITDEITGQRIEDILVSNCEANLYRSVGTSSFQLNLAEGDCCEISVEAPGYLGKSVEICGDPDLKKLDIPLQRPETSKDPEPGQLLTKNVPASPGTEANRVEPVAMPPVLPPPPGIPDDPVIVIPDPELADAQPILMPIAPPRELPVDPVINIPAPEPVDNAPILAPVAPPREEPIDPVINIPDPDLADEAPVLEPVPLPNEQPVDPVITTPNPEPVNNTPILEPVAPPREEPIDPVITIPDPEPVISEPIRDKDPVEATAGTGAKPGQVKKRVSPPAAEESPEINKPVIRTRRTTKYLIGTVYDPLNSRPIPFATIHLLNTTCGVNIKIQSDNSGHYRLPLVSNCCINIRVEKEGFQTYTALDALCTDKEGNVKGSTSILLKPDPDAKPPEYQLETSSLLSSGAFEGFERSKNTKAEDADLTFVLNVYYESARTSVKEESVKDLKKLLSLLEENSTLIVEIGAHTDSRGSRTFNQSLSQRRAENVVEYLVSQGIDERRLIPKGYGETQLINNCDDSIECSDEEHQFNRRTEFKIIGKIESTE